MFFYLSTQIIRLKNFKCILPCITLGHQTFDIADSRSKSTMVPDCISKFKVSVQNTNKFPPGTQLQFCSAKSVRFSDFFFVHVTIVITSRCLRYAPSTHKKVKYNSEKKYNAREQNTNRNQTTITQNNSIATGQLIPEKIRTNKIKIDSHSPPPLTDHRFWVIFCRNTILQWAKKPFECLLIFKGF